LPPHVSKMLNIKLIIAYDGSSFLGWQKASSGPSIEASLQNALEQLFQQTIVLQAASRTDAGVHALGQVVNFFIKNENLDLEGLCKSLNSLLPKEMSVLQAEVMPESFHPTIDSIGKEYHYAICQGPTQLPHHRLYSWHSPSFLNLKAMREAALQLIGEYDFSAFCNIKHKDPYTNKVRKVTSIEIIELADNRLRIEVMGIHFLYKMVRNIVGTLVYVGNGKLKVEDVQKILKEGDRKSAGITAPSHGLTLYKVFYP